MEKLRSRVLVFAGIMLALGTFNIITGMAGHGPGKTEQWMESQTPDEVDELAFMPSSENPEQSYRMDDRTYEYLAPYGIVARLYGNANRSYDVVLIASRSRASFHDPRVCFSGQGWTLVEQTTETVKSKTRGEVKVTLTTMDGPRKKGALAAFLYRGPSGFHPSTVGLKWDMFVQRLMNRTNTDGVFYRFIPQQDKVTKEELLDFIGKFLDAANESSNGYY